MIVTAFIIASALTLGTILTLNRAGEKEGICNYEYVGGKEE